MTSVMPPTGINACGILNRAHAHDESILAEAATIAWQIRDMLAQCVQLIHESYLSLQDDNKGRQSST